MIHYLREDGTPIVIKRPDGHVFQLHWDKESNSPLTLTHLDPETLKPFEHVRFLKP